MNGKSCFFIGHRETPDTVLPLLQETVNKHIECYDVTEFVVGHYGNFDYLAAKAVIAANAVRHAGAKELYVRLACSDQTAYVSVTNSGAAPEGEIAEGGGLTSLRILVKKSGGSMEIKTVPRFELTVSVPVRREEAK